MLVGTDTATTLSPGDVHPVVMLHALFLDAVNFVLTDLAASSPLVGAMLWLLALTVVDLATMLLLFGFLGGIGATTGFPYRLGCPTPGPLVFVMARSAHRLSPHGPDPWARPRGNLPAIRLGSELRLAEHASLRVHVGCRRIPEHDKPLGAVAGSSSRDGAANVASQRRRCVDIGRDEYSIRRRD